MKSSFILKSLILLVSSSTIVSAKDGIELPLPVDDFPNTPGALVWPNYVSNVRIDYVGDRDAWKFELTENARVTAKSISSIDTYGYLYRAIVTYGPGSMTTTTWNLVAENNDAVGEPAGDFLIARNLAPGTYAVVARRQSTPPGTVYPPLGPFGTYQISISKVPLPTMEVIGMGVLGEVAILDEDTTASTIDGTDFGTVSTVGAWVERTFRIHNTGTTTLNLTGSPSIQESSAMFLVSSLPSGTSIAPSGFKDFKVKYLPGYYNGTHHTTIVIPSNDPFAVVYRFTIKGTAVHFDDHGNTNATATLVGADSVSSGTINYLGYPPDVDAFKFVLSSPRTVTMETLGTTDLRVAWVDGITILPSDPRNNVGGTNLKVTLAMPAGTHYIGIALESGSVGNYQLWVH